MYALNIKSMDKMGLFENLVKIYIQTRRKRINVQLILVCV